MKIIQFKQHLKDFYNIIGEFTGAFKDILQSLGLYAIRFLLENPIYIILLLLTAFFTPGVIASKSMEPYLTQYSVIVCLRVWPIKVWGYLFSTEPLACYLAKFYHTHDCVVNYPSKLFLDTKDKKIFHQVVCLTPQNKLVIANRPCYQDLTSVAVSKQLTKPYYTQSNMWFSYRVKLSLSDSARNSEIVNATEVTDIYLFTLTRIKLVGMCLLFLANYKWWFVTLLILTVLLESNELQDEQEEEEKKESVFNINSEEK